MENSKFIAVKPEQQQKQQWWNYNYRLMCTEPNHFTIHLFVDTVVWIADNRLPHSSLFLSLCLFLFLSLLFAHTLDSVTSERIAVCRLFMRFELDATSFHLFRLASLEFLIKFHVFNFQVVLFMRICFWRRFFFTIELKSVEHLHTHTHTLAHKYRNKYYIRWSKS